MNARPQANLENPNQNPNQIPEWARLEREVYPIWQGAPRQYRFDGESGLFVLGTSRSLNELWIQPIEWRWEDEARWGRPHQGWMDLAFVDSDHCVGVCSFKKSSAVNVFDYIVRLEAGKVLEAPVRQQAVWLKLVGVEQRTLNGEPYFVVEVEESRFATAEQLFAVLEFSQLGRMNWQMVGEVG